MNQIFSGNLTKSPKFSLFSSSVYLMKIVESITFTCIDSISNLNLIHSIDTINQFNLSIMPYAWYMH